MGIHYYQTQKTPYSLVENSVHSPSPLPTKAETAISSAMPDGETANWKTFTSARAGYTVKYPQGLEVYNETTDPYFRIVYGEVEHESSIYIQVLAAPDLSLNDWVTTNIIQPVNDKSTVKQSLISKNGRQIILVTGAYFPAAFDSEGAYVLIDQKIVELKLEPLSNENQDDKYAQTILTNMASIIQLDR